jgi:hypothetical protein
MIAEIQIRLQRNDKYLGLLTDRSKIDTKFGDHCEHNTEAFEGGMQVKL